MSGRKPLDERSLLLLGLLLVQSQHGYRLNDFIERNLGRVTTMKKPTAYALLERLCAEGYVTAAAEPGTGRRPRRVYSITPAGEACFQTLLREKLTSPDQPVATADIGLMFIDHLPAAEAIACLTARLQGVEAQLGELERRRPHGFGIGVDLAIDQVMARWRADRESLQTALARLRRQAAAPRGERD